MLVSLLLQEMASHLHTGHRLEKETLGSRVQSLEVAWMRVRQRQKGQRERKEAETSMNDGDGKAGHQNTRKHKAEIKNSRKQGGA